MSKIYNIIHLDGITYIRFSRRPVYDEIAEIIDDIAENYPYEMRLWDVSNVGLDLNNNEIRKIAEYGKKKFQGHSRMAIVAKQDLAYGIARVFEVYREQLEASARVFRNEDDAVSWLNNEQASAKK